jgi:hypothetical protein
MSNIDDPGAPGVPRSVSESDNDLTAKIERLVELHATGQLTDAEFSQAKATLLSGGTGGPDLPPAQPPRATTGPTLHTSSGAGTSPAASTHSSQIPANPATSPNPHLAPSAPWPGRPGGPPSSPPGHDASVPELAPTLGSPHRSPRKLLALVIVVAILVVGGVIAYSTIGSRKPHETVHGTFTISNGSYDPTNEFEDPNYTGGVDGCEGDGGYGDLNSSTQVVVKDDHGEEVTRTELGTGHDTGDGLFGGCKFDFTFDVTKGPKYFVVSVGHRGESKYTFEELSDPHAIELSIGS